MCKGMHTYYQRTRGCVESLGHGENDRLRLLQCNVGVEVMTDVQQQKTQEMSRIDSIRQGHDTLKRRESIFSAAKRGVPLTKCREPATLRQCFGHSGSTPIPVERYTY